MRNLKETDFPPPPFGRTGWPWTEASPQLPDTMPDGSPWPRISIVTPSYNQGQFIEETIRSVLLQGYPNLEYIIMDGGSTDESMAIIQKYEPWLTYWVSEPDGGQADAINKGWRMATGAYITWLNSDDMLKPQGLERSMEALWNEKLDLVYGAIAFIDANSAIIKTLVGNPFSLEQMIRYGRNPVRQQGFLMKQAMLQEVGYLDDSLHCAMDFDYWIRLALWGASARPLPNELAAFRLHAETKTARMHMYWIKDYCQICDKVYGEELSVEAASWEREARAFVALKCANKAYQAGDSALMRRYALKHIKLMRLRSLFTAWKVLLLSFFGDHTRITLQHLAAVCRRDQYKKVMHNALFAASASFRSSTSDSRAPSKGKKVDL